jgi:hypothetical protein
MNKQPPGATWADAIIAGLQFAEHHPYRYLLTVPVTMAVAFVAAAFVLKIVVLGPITNHRAEYDTARRRAKRDNSTGQP